MSGRYERQMRLREIGEAGQRRLSEARVLVVGAGGLGCPALQYLAGAGVGTLGIVDGDRVELDNLHRQILYATGEVGQSKALCAMEALRRLNPQIAVRAYAHHLDAQTAWELLSGYHLVIDATDDFAARYLISDACALLDKPLIYGAVSAYAGQVTRFDRDAATGRRTHYRDVFPAPPTPGSVPTCAEAGVLGPLPGIIGAMQAAEAITWITGIGDGLAGKLLLYDLRTHGMTTLRYAPTAQGAAGLPRDRNAFMALHRAVAISEIDPDDLADRLHDGATLLIDVREEEELPVLDIQPHLRLPLSRFALCLHEIESRQVVLVCRTGKRSRQAAAMLERAWGGKGEVTSLKGGLAAWQKAQQRRKVAS